MSGDDLPVILVSAVDAAAADTITSELVDNEVECLRSEGARVWELCNKYYTARVRVCALTDTPPAPCPAAPPAEAHVIYLAEHECTGSTLERRAGRVADGECEVRLAVCAGARGGARPEGEGLREAAHKHGYELVYLCESSPAEPGPFPELRGAERVREALHTHTWPNLRLRTEPAARPAPANNADDDDFSPFQSYQNGASSPESVGSRTSSPEPSEEECVRRAELLASALAAMEGTRGEGAVHAEQLVAAFCRALGTDIDRL